MKDIFDPPVTAEFVERIRTLTPESGPEWGKMDVAQMLAHCCVPYEIALDDSRPRPGAVKRFVMRLLVKPGVVSEKPYRRNTLTAPEFRVSDPRDFESERTRLIGHLEHCRDLGRDHFDGRDYPNFGRLTADEWNNLFYKHLDHHLTQFGV